MRCGTIILTFIVCIQLSLAQQLNMPLNHQMSLRFNELLEGMDSIPMHVGIKPFKENTSFTLYDYVNANSTWNKKQFATFFADRTWLKRKLKFESFFGARDKNVSLEINPLINFEYGRDVGRNDRVAMYKNTRGFTANVHLTNKFSFSTSFYENQVRVQTYLMEYAQKAGPQRINAAGNFRTDNGYANFFGQGRTKPFKEDGYDFAMSTGYVSFAALKNWNIQFGTDKHFIGYGYRSLLLSDNSFVYPFLKSSLDLMKGRLKYVVMYSSLQSLRRLPSFTTPEATFERKAMSMQYVSYLVNRKLEVAFFESTMWQRMENFQQKAFDYSMLNPVPLVNVVRFGFDSTNNTMVGVQGKYRIMKNMAAYGQVMFDGVKDNLKTGFQLGFNWYKPFGYENICFSAEYNFVSPYSYTNRTVLQNYGHYNLPMAHPWGAGFNEWLVFFNWRNDDWFFDNKWIYGTSKWINGNDYGRNIFLSSVQPVIITEKLTAQTVYADFKIGHVINPITNLRMYLGFTNYYRFNGRGRDNSNYLYLGISTSLTNIYLDI